MYKSYKMFRDFFIFFFFFFFKGGGGKTEGEDLSLSLSLSNQLVYNNRQYSSTGGEEVEPNPNTYI